jgi:hypothetical protein
MRPTSGNADGGRPHMQPYPRPPRMPSAGVYAAQVGPILSLKCEEYARGELYVGLLTRHPFPEGHGYEELVGEGYARQPIRVNAFTSERDANTDLISFGAVGDDWPAASHLGVFNGDGKLVAYGRLASMSRLLMTGEVRFQPQSILLKRPIALPRSRQ